MKRFKNILAIHNQAHGAGATLRRATTLARRNGARLTVADITQSLDFFGTTIGIQPELVASRVAMERGQYLRRWIASIRHEGVDVRYAPLHGTPVRAIIQAVLREEHELVIVKAEDEGTLKKMLFGSTSMHLIRECPCPVWVMKPGGRYSRILAAVGPHASGENNDALNTLIMDLATSLARSDQSELHVVHAWILDDPDREISHSEMARLNRRNRQERGVDALLSRYELEDLSYRVHVVQGRPRSVIPRVVASLRTDLLVMGTMSRTGVARFFIGNTAEEVLRHVDCSVLVLKTPGELDTPAAILADASEARGSLAPAGPERATLPPSASRRPPDALPSAPPLLRRRRFEPARGAPPAPVRTGAELAATPTRSPPAVRRHVRREPSSGRCRRTPPQRSVVGCGR